MSESSGIALYIDPPSHHFLGDRLFEVETGALTGDQVNAPYARLRDIFASRGIPVHTSDYLPKEIGSVRNIYISVGPPLSDYRRVAKRRDTSLSAYLVLECPIVDPPMFRDLARARKYFKRIFSFADSASLERFVGRSLQIEPMLWPQAFDTVHEGIWEQEDRQFLVIINANKLPPLTWQELYTERLRAVEFFGRDGEIDLYGHGWDGPPYRIGKTWMPATMRRLQRQVLSRWQQVRPDPLQEAARRAHRGIAASKSETLGRYSFAICFENMVLKGWITEKIFDCFYAGTVPVYLGEPTIEEHIPSECFIDMRRFSGYDELRRYLKSLSRGDIRKYKESARAFLASPGFRPFSTDTFVETFQRIVEEDAGISFATATA